MNVWKPFLTRALLLALLAPLSLLAQVDITPMPAQLLPAEGPAYAAAHHLLEAAVTGDFDQMRRLLAPDFLAYGASPDSLHAEAYVQLWAGYHAEATGLALSQGQMFAISTEALPGIDAAALFWGVAQWTPQGAPQPVYAWTHLVIGLSGDQVKLVYTFQDQLPVMLQYGFSLVPPSGSDGGK